MSGSNIFIIIIAAKTKILRLRKCNIIEKKHKNKSENKIRIKRMVTAIKIMLKKNC